MAGDRGGHAAAQVSQAHGAGTLAGAVQQLPQQRLDLLCREFGRGGLDGHGTPVEAFDLESVALQFLGQLFVHRCLARSQRHDDGREQPLDIGAPVQAGRQHLFEQDTLVGDVLVDDPHAIVARRDDETVEKLAQQTQVGQLAQVGRRQVCKRFAAMRRGGLGDQRGAGWRRLWHRRSGRPVGLPTRLRRELQRVGDGPAQPAGSARNRHGTRHRRRSARIWPSSRRAGEGVVDHCGGRQVRGRLGGDQPGANRVPHEIEHPGWRPEADLGLGGVDIDVHLFRRDLQEQQHERVHATGHQVFVALGNGLLD